MASEADMMTISMVRLLKGRKNAFHGVASPMPIVAILAAQKLYDDGLVYLNIAGGVDAKPKVLKKSTVGHNVIHGTKALFPLAEVFDLSMRGGLDVAFLGGVQFDGSGRVNNSVIGAYDKPKVKLPGGAGSAVLVPTVENAILWRTKHDARSFVPACDFVTTTIVKGYVVTPLCVMLFENGAYKVVTINPGHTTEEIAENTGFPLDFSQAAAGRGASAEEMAALREVDPDNIRSIEF